MFEVIKAGLETSIQDWPGRIGFWNKGFPPSGPMDSWSFRLANLLVGNPLGEAGLECQFMGPTLRFQRDTVIALTGADMQAKLDDLPCPMWESIAVRSGQTLTLSFAKLGARTYIAFAGGIDAPLVLGSRATFHKAGVGGLDGYALKAGQTVPVLHGRGRAGRRVKAAARPLIHSEKLWQVEVVAGPNDDWIDAAGHAQFLSTHWKVSSKSDRTGFRLEGPPWTFTAKAYNKLPEHGSEPANILDQGYPLGAINLAGQTPIILVSDGPSMGGFINPYTVPSCAFWKLAQARPGESFSFKAVSVTDAQATALAIKGLCVESSIEN
jgi:5-oxoprolinase (ATP-hydrolysing) subunit C